MAPRLFEIPLPAGDVPGFDVGFDGDHAQQYDPRAWLDKGYAGVRIVGAGDGLRRTHIRAEDGWHNSTVFCGPTNSIVQLENLTLHVAKSKGLHMGLARQAVLPNFKAVLRGVDVVADGQYQNADGTSGRRVWGVFGYQCDWDLEDVTFDTAELAEHASYAHGFAKTGLRWTRVKVNGCGSQGLKVRNGPDEVSWIPNARISAIDCTFKGFGQPWGWRGGGGIVIEGGNADVLVERCGFWGRPGNFRCLMIDDGAGAFRGYGDARAKANGHVIVSACGFNGGPGSESYSPMVRVGTTNAARTWPTVKSFTMEGCGLWGERTQLQYSDVPAGKFKVRGCNTPQLVDFANAVGFDTRLETQIIGAKSVFVPISAGVSR